ncbi:hypothetical protein E4K72_07855 [Oxalobacteraceae bacterium OM1]|nr:hypothetical protein E4K72_07855 [Oxalobacteraceae bacterium OM1]
MKSLLLLLILSICAIAWRSEDIVNALAKGGVMPGSSGHMNIQSMTASSAGGMKTMSVNEFAELSKSDPKAAQKFLQSRTQADRTGADKLMNLLARGKYE